MTTTTSTATPKINGRSNARRLLLGGAFAAGAGIVVAETYAAIIKVAGVPMRAGFLGAAHPSALTGESFATGVLVCTFWATLLGAVLVRTASRPGRTFVRTVSVLAAISLAVPIGAGATATATKVALVGAHILVASVVIPILYMAVRLSSD